MSQSYIPEKLPRRITRTMTEQYGFGGLEGHPGATGDKIRYMENLSSDAYPALSVRRGYRRYENLFSMGGAAKPHGILYHNDWYVAQGIYLYRIDDEGGCQIVAYVSDTDKSMAVLDDKLYIFPDKLVYDPVAGTCKSMSLSRYFQSGITIDGETLTYNSQTWSGMGFAVGDGVRISTVTALGETFSAFYSIQAINKYDMVLDRPLEASGVSFYVERLVPKLEGVCVYDRRLWGFCGGRVYACATGNPNCWFEDPCDVTACGGFAQDDHAPVLLDTMSAGDCTACITWQNNVLFFKQDSICKCLGKTAWQYALIETPCVGVSKGGRDSLGVVDGNLYYVSHHGVYVYDGAYPREVQVPPDVTWETGVGGSDGKLYYLCAPMDDGTYVLYTYDPSYKAWYRQEPMQVSFMARKENILGMLTATGELVQTDGIFGRDTMITQGAETSIALQAFAIFCDEVSCIHQGQRLHKLYLSCQGDADSTLNIRISYDGDPQETTLATIQGEESGWVAIPVPSVRCQYYHLRLDMTGPWRIYALHRVYEKGCQS